MAVLQFSTNKILFFSRFVCRNNGVLYESDLMQIGVKSEYRQNLGRICLFFGNKTMLPFTSFSVNASHISGIAHLNVQCKPIDGILEGGAQKQQMVNIECNSDFTEPPVIHISFM